jgi:hypothetical protein
MEFLRMKSQLLNSGALVCSAMIIYGWAQAAASESDRPTCNARQSASPTIADDCTPPINLATLSNVPEKLLNLQWSQRPLAQASHPVPIEMENFYDKKLEQAQAAANREHFSQAINQVVGIPKNSRHYELAQRLQADWSREIVRQSTEYCQKAQMKQALTLLATLPPNSVVTEQARELRGAWQKQAELWHQAIAAKEQGDWQSVITTLKLLEDTPLYQSLPVQDLMQQAVTQLHEPDQKLLTVAMGDLPTVTAEMAESEVIDRHSSALMY